MEILRGWDIPFELRRVLKVPREHRPLLRVRAADPAGRSGIIAEDLMLFSYNAHLDGRGKIRSIEVTLSHGTFGERPYLWREVAGEAGVNPREQVLTELHVDWQRPRTGMGEGSFEIFLASLPGGVDPRIIQRQRELESALPTPESVYPELAGRERFTRKYSSRKK